MAGLSSSAMSTTGRFGADVTANLCLGLGGQMDQPSRSRSRHDAVPARPYPSGAALPDLSRAKARDSRPSRLSSCAVPSTCRDVHPDPHRRLVIRPWREDEAPRLLDILRRDGDRQVARPPATARHRRGGAAPRSPAWATSCRSASGPSRSPRTASPPARSCSSPIPHSEQPDGIVADPDRVVRAPGRDRTRLRHRGRPRRARVRPGRRASPRSAPSPTPTTTRR